MLTSQHQRQHRSSGIPRLHRRRLTLLAALVGGFAAVAALLSLALASTGSGAKRSSIGTALSAAAFPAGLGSDCTLIVPENPLSARGLATPYQLVASGRGQGPCHEANARQAAFVQATVVDPASGAVYVYNPVVVDRGSRPAAAPVVPWLPHHAVVGIWFGFNGRSLTLRGQDDSLRAGRCTDGSSDARFGRFAYCNASAFFNAAGSAVRTGTLTVPALGTGRDGAPCPTTRDFGFADQNPSTGVTAVYLVDRNGRIAQWTQRNSTRLDTVATLTNGGDVPLLNSFIDPALGCSPWRAPDLANPGHHTTSLALDELQAARRQHAPMALVPLNAPMALMDQHQSRSRTDLYRLGVGQPLVGWTAKDGDPAAYCARLASLSTWRLNFDRKLLLAAVSPDRAANLFTFLSTRLTISLVDLQCRQAVLPTRIASPTPTPSQTQAQTPTPSTSASTSPSPTTNPTTSPTPAPSKPGDKAPQPSTVASTS
ncbi:hypothetical protein ABIA33_002105 [Streptacidiphilus sp. MAP12-16]|uniref:hypothetical protein n=1 Tax=Streptacidiphilus sp. MAP12-16 TaxID=3156300 RepID=UPI003511ABD5